MEIFRPIICTIFLETNEETFQFYKILFCKQKKVMRSLVSNDLSPAHRQFQCVFNNDLIQRK